MKEQKFESYFGRVLAVDASMHIYQFMAVVGRQGDQQLTNEAGDVTSHLQGMFYRTIRMLDAGIKPIYVFDGKPPTLKSGELAKRADKRAAAVAQLEDAKDEGNKEEEEKQAKRNLRVTREHNEECKRLLRLLGVPVVEAPCEAEASCAELVKHGKAYAVASEDMDTLTFMAPKLARNVMAPASANKPVLEIDSAKAIEELGVTVEQFVDICICLGCDYCDPFKNIGPSLALKFIKQHGTIEKLIASLPADSRFQAPEDWPVEEARRLFLHPEVVDCSQLELKWTAPDEDGLVAFLCGEKDFNEDRVRNAVKKAAAAKGKASQGRLESFFGAVTTHKSTLGQKRAAEEVKGKGKGKAAGGPGAAKKSKGVSGRKK